MKNSNQGAVPLLGIFLYIWYCVMDIYTISFLSILNPFPLTGMYFINYIGKYDESTTAIHPSYIDFDLHLTHKGTATTLVYIWCIILWMKTAWKRRRRCSNLSRIFCRILCPFKEEMHFWESDWKHNGESKRWKYSFIMYF